MLCTTTPCIPPPRTVLASSSVVASRTSPLFIWPPRTLIMVFPVIYRYESWTIKKAEHQTIDAFELWCWRRLLRVHPKGDQPWIFIGRTDTEAKTPTLWPPDAKSRLTGKDPDAGKDWGQKKKGTTENEMVGWHHWHNGDKFEQTPGASGGQRSLVYCSPWGLKESDTTEWLSSPHSVDCTPRSLCCVFSNPALTLNQAWRRLRILPYSQLFVLIFSSLFSST